MYEQIIGLYHSTLSCAHHGVSRSLDLCRTKFYWPKQEDEFKLFIAACQVCAAVKQPPAYLKAPLRHLVFHKFGDCITIDHIVCDKLLKTPRGYRYILTISDMFSGYGIAVPVKTQTSAETVKLVYSKWILLFGWFLELICDNHPSFSNQFFEGIFKAFDSKVTHGTSYSKHSQGKAETYNKKVNNALRCIIPPGKENQWDLYLPYATFALNSLKNRRTGFSPNMLCFGRELNTPVDIVLDQDLHKGTIEGDSPNYKKAVYDLHKKVRNITRKVRIQAEADYMYAKTFYDKTLHGPGFKEGEKCYLLIECKQHKFSPRWRGPCIVKKVVNEHVYVVDLGNGQEKVVNISKLKHFVENKYTQRTPPITQAPQVPTISPATVEETKRQVEEPEFLTIEVDKGRNNDNFSESPASRTLPLPVHETIEEGGQEADQEPTEDSSDEDEGQNLDVETDDELDDIMRTSNSPQLVENTTPRIPGRVLRDRTKIKAPERYGSSQIPAVSTPRRLPQLPNNNISSPRRLPHPSTSQQSSQTPNRGLISKVISKIRGF